jgi:hypothetical protein
MREKSHTLGVSFHIIRKIFKVHPETKYREMIPCRPPGRAKEERAKAARRSHFSP